MTDHWLPNHLRCARTLLRAFFGGEYAYDRVDFAPRNDLTPSALE